MDRVNKIMTINLQKTNKKKNIENGSENPVCKGLGSELEDAALMKDGAALGVWGTKGKERWRGRPFSRLAEIPTSMHT